MGHKTWGEIMGKNIGRVCALVMLVAGTLVSVGAGRAGATAAAPACTATTEYRYAMVIPGTPAVTATQYRVRTRAALYGTEEIKSILGWDFVDGGTTSVAGQTVAGHWAAGDAGTWYVIPAVIINIVWGPSGVPPSVLGTGTVSLSAYGGPHVVVHYDAHQVTTDDGYTAWGPWSGWSTDDPGADTDTQQAQSRTVVVTPAVPDQTIYYVPNTWDSTTLTDANWTTDILPAPWYVVDQRTVTVAAACVIPAGHDTHPSGEASLSCGPSTSKVTLKVRRDGTLHGHQVRAKIRIGGLQPGATASGTATLIGPSARKHVPASAPRVGTVRFRHGNGTAAVALRVTRPGHYAWVISADGSSTRCRPPALAHRPRPDITHVPTGYDGEVAVAGRHAVPALSIPALGIHASVRTVGSSAGSMNVPGGAHTVGWLASSAAPGELIGTTVVAGHVSDRSDHPGALWNLRDAARGQVVTLDGHRFRVRSVSSYLRSKPLPRSLFATTGAHRLVLITCTGRESLPGGHFHYTRNLVVVATPIR
ncbi:class F sortase [Nocardioides sp.]|uniref:class F sortase n=1 Tax=Nocardioides sp. TaxID=35761 RepID=UPI002D8094C0|nr:class F sortase [Nocardioides sp.]